MLIRLCWCDVFKIGQTVAAQTKGPFVMQANICDGKCTLEQHDAHHPPLTSMQGYYTCRRGVL